MNTDYPGQMTSLEVKTFQKGAPTTLEYPLTSIPDPEGSYLVSPKIGNNHGLSDQITGNEKELLDEVLEVRGKVARGEFPHVFMEKYYPSEWGTYEPRMPQPLVNEKLRLSDPQGCATAVHMDSPVDMPLAVLSYVLGNGATLKVEDTGHLDFLNAVPDVIQAIGNDQAAALHKVFEVKYYFGIARPEEHACANFTAYPEGCPTHPSYPAGHGAAAGAGVAAIINHFNLPEDVLKHARDSAYFWSQFRTFAGVHYGLDNTAGLAIGGLLPIT